MTYLGQLIFNDGVEKGIEKGMEVLIHTCQSMRLSREKISDLIRQEFSLDTAETENYLERFWDGRISETESKL